MGYTPTNFQFYSYECCHWHIVIQYFKIVVMVDILSCPFMRNLYNWSIVRCSQFRAEHWFRHLVVIQLPPGVTAHIVYIICKEASRLSIWTSPSMSESRVINRRKALIGSMRENGPFFMNESTANYCSFPSKISCTFRDPWHKRPS